MVDLFLRLSKIPEYFLSMWLSGIFAVTNSDGDSTSL